MCKCIQTLFLMALSRSLTEFPLYVLNRLKSGMYTTNNWAHGFVVLRMCVCVCVYLSVGAQRCASSSWCEPQLFLHSPAWARWGFRLVPSLCGRSHPANKHTWINTLMHLFSQTNTLFLWCNAPGKRAAASQGSRKTDVWARRSRRAGFQPRCWSFALSNSVLWYPLILKKEVLFEFQVLDTLCYYMCDEKQFEKLE